MVSLSQCPGQPDASRILEAAELDVLYDWLDQYTGVDVRASDDSRYLVAGGFGLRQPTEHDLTMLEDWLRELP